MRRHNAHGRPTRSGHTKRETDKRETNGTVPDHGTWQDESSRARGYGFMRGRVHRTGKRHGADPGYNTEHGHSTERAEPIA
eukprot:6152936-Prymnesium_polylepis.1